MTHTATDSAAHAGLHELANRHAEEAARLTGPDVTDIAGDTSLLNRVMARHSVTTQRLAAEADLDPSYISRLTTGRYQVPLVVFRALLRRTNDRELLDYLSTDDRQVISVQRASEAQRETALFDVVREAHDAASACHYLLYAAASAAYSADRLTSERERIERRISECIGSMLELRRHAIAEIDRREQLLRDQTSKVERAYADPAATGGLTGQKVRVSA